MGFHEARAQGLCARLGLSSLTRCTSVQVVVDAVSVADDSSLASTVSTVLVASSMVASDTSHTTIHILPNISGVLGLQKSFNSTFGGLRAGWVASHPSAGDMVGLDFRRDPNSWGASPPTISTPVVNGSMQVGGMLPSMAPHMVWSEKTPMPNTLVPLHRVFDMRLCGAPIFGNYSSNWLTLVDTGSVCLSLPDELFLAIMSWLPADCANPINGRCRVLPHAQASLASLPHITFRMSESSPQLALPVGSLVVGTGSSMTFCIRSSGHPAVDPTILRPEDQKLTFGSLVVASLYTVIDSKTTRLGYVVLC